MGNSQSSYYGMTEEMLAEYEQLTYLNRTEIYSLLKTFALMPNAEMMHNFNQRIPVKYIIEAFPQIKYNPFCDRICEVFSSQKDECFSFEDLLDFCSVMSDRCPHNIKAVCAFRIFDFNGDRAIDKNDLMTIIDRLTKRKDQQIKEEEQMHIVEIILKAMDMEKNGNIEELEFEHAIGKMSDFGPSFTFTV